MRSSACDTLSRSCDRYVLCWLAFPLASALCSTDSAAGCPALFVSFPATMAESDFPPPCVIGYGSSPSRCGPRPGTQPSVKCGTSRFPYKELLHMPGSSTTPGRQVLAYRHLVVLPSALETASAPGNIEFRGSMAGLCPPLPTLRHRSYERCRTARGRCGSLLLHRSGLAPPTPCRSPGALRVSHAQPRSHVSVGHPDEWGLKQMLRSTLG